MRRGAQEAAFDLEALYREHADAVFTLAWRITGSREDAEDVLQDLFVGLPRALASYREQGRFESCAAGDASYLAREFAPVFSSEDLISLPQYAVYIKLSIDGGTSRPFSAVTIKDAQL